MGDDRVLYAAHPNAQAITWQEFCQSFHSHYVPSGEIKVKRKEFLELKQGSMSVHEYLTKFTQLSRYASSDVDTNDKKQDCFRDGLNPGIRYALSSNEYDTFQKLVDKAFTVERERKVLEADRKRKMAF